jgi:hypothetical protein
MNDEYFQTRLLCIKYSAKRWGYSKIKTSRTIVAFTPFVSDPMMKFTLFELNASDYQTYLLFTFLDYNNTDPITLFELKGIDLSEKNNNARKTQFTINTSRLTKIIKKFYPKIDFSQIPDDGRLGILLYIAMKYKMFKEA